MKQDTYCMFCKTKKWVYTKKHVSFINWVLSGFCSIIISFLLFQDLVLKSIIFWGLCVAIAEIFIHLRWRLSMICHECGFDPILYLKDQKQAALKVKIRLEQRAQDPSTYLKPPLKIPVRLIMPNGIERIVPASKLNPKQIRLLSLNLSQKPNTSQQGNQKSHQRQSVTLSQVS